MPSYSVSASEIKYASGSSWTSGKARQGVYSSTRYEGALNFAGLANFSFSNIAVTGIRMLSNEQADCIWSNSRTKVSCASA